MLLFVASPKTKMINVRLVPRVHDDFKIACDLKGVSMSSLMHQFVVKTIREEKERDPQAFIRQTEGEKHTFLYREPIGSTVDESVDKTLQTETLQKRKKVR